MPWTALLSCFLLLLLPLGLIIKFRLGLMRDLLIGVARMTLQLLLAGLYLGYLFAWYQLITLLQSPRVL